MKSFLLVLISTLSLSALATPPPIPNGEIPGGWSGDDYHGRGHSCAPEVVEGNVAATDRTLKSFAVQFQAATVFRLHVAQITALHSADAKVAQYFSLIGIDSRNSRDVAEFVGARSIDARWISALESSTGLSNSQARAVAEKLQATLRGNLQ